MLSYRRDAKPQQNQRNSEIGRSINVAFPFCAQTCRKKKAYCTTVEKGIKIRMDERL